MRQINYKHGVPGGGPKDSNEFTQGYDNRLYFNACKDYLEGQIVSVEMVQLIFNCSPKRAKYLLGRD